LSQQSPYHNIPDTRSCPQISHIGVRAESAGTTEQYCRVGAGAMEPLNLDATTSNVSYTTTDDHKVRLRHRRLANMTSSSSAQLRKVCDFCIRYNRSYIFILIHHIGSIINIEKP